MQRNLCGSLTVCFRTSHSRGCKLTSITGHWWAKPLQGKESKGKFLRKACTQQHPLPFSDEQGPSTAANPAMVLVNKWELMKAWSKTYWMSQRRKRRYRELVQHTWGGTGLCADLLALVKSQFTSAWIPIARLCWGCSRSDLHPTGSPATGPCLWRDEPWTGEKHQSCPPTHLHWLSQTSPRDFRLHRAMLPLAPLPLPILKSQTSTFLPWFQAWKQTFNVRTNRIYHPFSHFLQILPALRA